MKNDLQIAKLNSGDIVIVQGSGEFMDEQFLETVHNIVVDKMPNNVKVLTLPLGVSLTIVNTK